MVTRSDVKVTGSCHGLLGKVLRSLMGYTTRVRSKLCRGVSS
ncbi:hypothetical protein NC652_036736 [Populus alba x Populus x berolinensis]|nr:hypothetical protein NC652_036736 [Populus alba x Populus x berolinensis]